MTSYTEAEKAVYRDAMRSIPGMMAAISREDREGASMLLGSFHHAAGELEVKPGQSWAILFTASMHWLGQLADNLREGTTDSREDVAQEMATCALAWDSSGASRGQ